MHHGVERTREDGVQRGGVVEAGPMQDGVRGHGVQVAGGEVVQDLDLVSLLAQERRGGAADVAGAAGDQDAHR